MIHDPVCRVQLDQSLLWRPRSKPTVEKKATGTPKSYNYEHQKNSTKYQDLHPDSQLLGRQLFQTLQTIAKGSLPSVIRQLTGQCACYTFSIIAIWRHHWLSSAICKLSTMTPIDPHARAAISRQRRQMEDELRWQIRCQKCSSQKLHWSAE